MIIPAPDLAAILDHCHQFTADYKISMRALQALALIADEPMTIGYLGEQLGVSNVSATVAADSLETKGLAERIHASDDRRKVLLKITEAGQVALTRN